MRINSEYLKQNAVHCTQLLLTPVYNKEGFSSRFNLIIKSSIGLKATENCRRMLVRRSYLSEEKESNIKKEERHHKSCDGVLLMLSYKVLCASKSPDRARLHMLEVVQQQYVPQPPNLRYSQQLPQRYKKHCLTTHICLYLWAKSECSWGRWYNTFLSHSQEYLYQQDLFRRWVGGV